MIWNDFWFRIANNRDFFECKFWFRTGKKGLQSSSCSETMQIYVSFSLNDKWFENENSTNNKDW
jgi:hypothetical protein